MHTKIRTFGGCFVGGLVDSKVLLLIYVYQRDLPVGLKALLPVTSSYLGIWLPGPKLCGGWRRCACATLTQAHTLV